ncbi:hypothetical protein [Bacillus massilinigeriensis]|uniref:hypothetical protein n=1 Tax=Bacillus massilionigeriensis TaxID=1805475 RepID=UPI00096B42D8|nr:hypothetical protein [Bacillus massilionigeriensis]
MVVVHFFNNKSIVLSQLLDNIPNPDENIKIKGRKGKVISVEQVDESKYHVHVHFEPVVKKVVLDLNKKKRK